jgi:hypothetical protein
MNEFKNMDLFVEKMAEAFKIAKEIEGISRINWSISYIGTTEATNEIAKRIHEEMVKAGVCNASLKLN